MKNLKETAKATTIETTNESNESNIETANIETATNVAKESKSMKVEETTAKATNESKTAKVAKSAGRIRRVKTVKTPKKVSKVSKTAATESTFVCKYEDVALNSKEFKVAEKVWWRKTADTRIATEFGIDIEKLPALYESKKYAQAVQNLLCVQWDSLEEFEFWSRSFPRPGIGITLSKRLKIDKDLINSMIEGAKKHYSAIESGKEIKTMKQRQNPRSKK